MLCRGSVAVGHLRRRWRRWTHSLSSVWPVGLLLCWWWTLRGRHVRWITLLLLLLLGRRRSTTKGRRWRTLLRLLLLEGRERSSWAHPWSLRLLRRRPYHTAACECALQNGRVDEIHHEHRLKQGVRELWVCGEEAMGVFRRCQDE